MLLVNWECAPGLSCSRFDINAPVLSMLEGAKGEAPTVFDSSRSAEMVESYAPGYLAMEAQGYTAEYDLTHLMKGFDVYHSVSGRF